MSPFFFFFFTLCAPRRFWCLSLLDRISVTVQLQTRASTAALLFALSLSLSLSPWCKKRTGSRRVLTGQTSNQPTNQPLVLMCDRRVDLKFPPLLPVMPGALAAAVLLVFVCARSMVVMKWTVCNQCKGATPQPPCCVASQVNARTNERTDARNEGRGGGLLLLHWACFWKADFRSQKSNGRVSQTVDNTGGVCRPELNMSGWLIFVVVLVMKMKQPEKHLGLAGWMITRLSKTGFSMESSQCYAIQLFLAQCFGFFFTRALSIFTGLLPFASVVYVCVSTTFFFFFLVGCLFCSQRLINLRFSVHPW